MESSADREGCKLKIIQVQKTLAPCKRSACELFRDHLLDPRSFFCRREGQQILVECSPRPEVNVDVHSQNLDVQRLSARSGLRRDPKYSSCVGTKTHKKCRALQCYCVTGEILYDVPQIAKSLKTLVFYSL